MKIAIISDSHDNVPNIKKFLDWANKNEIKMIIHCGDVAAPSIIKKLFSVKFSGEMHLVHGNVSDRDVLEEVCDEYDNITLHGDIGEISLPLGHPVATSPQAGGEKLKIAFCHFPDQAKELAGNGKYNLVFYGHTHKPWMEKADNGCSIINPGTLGGLFQKASFAVYDTDSGKLDLKILEQI